MTLHVGGHLSITSTNYTSSINPTNKNFNRNKQQLTGYFTMIPVPDNSSTI